MGLNSILKNLLRPEFNKTKNIFEAGDSNNKL